ncbi:hypothetical protein AADZ90_004995 [Aestuariibius sp. 2305UL40-4]|uniref:hypothetical protein n=1 Tax=Aestuariibius violaceus TaxID=3234132 RepID=UPI00345E12E6
MDLKWDTCEDDNAPPFDNDTDPAIHYWLSQLPVAAPGLPTEDKRRSTLDQTVRLSKSAEELVERAFGGVDSSDKPVGKSLK